MKKNQVLILSFVSLFSAFSNAYVKPESKLDISVTELRKISSISVGHDGSWYIGADTGWGLNGCPDVTSMRIVYNHYLKEDYIKILSMINDYSTVKVSANAVCASDNNFVIDVQKFITVHKPK